MTARQVKYRRMTAIQWDGADSTFDEVKKLLLETHAAERVERVEFGLEFQGGNDHIRFAWGGVMNAVIPRGEFVVVPHFTGARALVLTEYNFHAQFEDAVPASYEDLRNMMLEQAVRADWFEWALKKIAAPGSTGVTDIAREALGRNWGKKSDVG